MIRLPFAAVIAVSFATLSVSFVVAGQDAPPDNLSVTGASLSWRDNSSSETGFQVSIMPVGGQAAPVFTHTVGANVTSFDLSTDSRACSGRIAVGVAALMPDGTVLTAPSLVDVDIRAACAQATPILTSGTPAVSGTPRPSLPSTGTGGPTRSLADTAALLSFAGALLFGAATCILLKRRAERS